MDSKTKLFSLIWGQSSKATQSKIETHLNYGQCYLGVLRGKTTGSKANPIKEHFFDVPEPKNIVLSVDLMYCTGQVFLTTVSRNIRFITTTLLMDRKKKMTIHAIKQVIKIHQGKGHKIDDVDFNEEDEN